MPSSQLKEVARERDRDRRHAAGLDYQQQRPAIEESEERMVSFAQIGILPADLWQTLSQFGVDERTGKRNDAARDPRSQNERRSVDLLGDHVGIDEDTRPNNAAHHQHCRVEESKPARELWLAGNIGPGGRHAYPRSGSAGEIRIRTSLLPKTGCFALSVTLPGSCFARTQIAPPPPTRLNGFSPMISAGPSRLSSIEAVE